MFFGMSLPSNVVIGYKSVHEIWKCMCFISEKLNWYFDHFLPSMFILHTLCNFCYEDIKLPGLILKFLIFSFSFFMSFLFTLYFEMLNPLYYMILNVSMGLSPWYTVSAKEIIAFSSFSPSFSFSSVVASFFSTLLLLLPKQYVRYLGFWLNSGFCSLSLHVVYVDLCSQSREILNNVEVNQKGFVNYHLLNTHSMTENLLNWLPLKHDNSHKNL